MTIWTKTAKRSMSRMIGDLSTLKEGRFSSGDGRVCGGSLMTTSSMIKLKNKAPVAIKKEVRMPKISESTPPNRGPITLPAVKAPCIMPRQKPVFSVGA